MSGKSPPVFMATCIRGLIQAVVRYQDAPDILAMQYNQLYVLLDRALSDNGEWFAAQAARDTFLVPSCDWFITASPASTMREQLLECLRRHRARDLPVGRTTGLLQVYQGKCPVV